MLDQPLWLLAFALVPPIALMIFIIAKDKHKDSFGYLLKLFFFGVLSIIPAVILELIGKGILDNLYLDQVIEQLVLAFLIVGPAEELSKYFMLRKISWKNPKFDYSYNGIVFSVFVSLGFASLENVLYVYEGGIGTAIGRALTSIPGHATFGVFMGYFYIKAKSAQLKGKKGKMRGYLFLTCLVPILVHGMYDALLFVVQCVDEDVVPFIVIGWLVFTVVSFIISFITVNREAKREFLIDTNKAIDPNLQALQQQTYVPAGANPVGVNVAPVMTQTAVQPTPVATVDNSVAPVASTPSGAYTVPVAAVAASVPVAAKAPSAAATPVAAQAPVAAAAPVAASVPTAPIAAAAASAFSQAKDLSAPSVWYCTSCGNKNSAMFCTACGTRKPVM